MPKKITIDINHLTICCLSNYQCTDKSAYLASGAFDSVKFGTSVPASASLLKGPIVCHACMQGPPVVEVKSWNQESNKVCIGFPIVSKIEGADWAEDVEGGERGGLEVASEVCA